MSLLEANSPHAEREPLTSKDLALGVLRRNRERAGTKFTPPDGDWYQYPFLWDGAFCAMVEAHYGEPEQGVVELRSIFEGQNPETGFIPNMRIEKHKRRFDPEWLTFMDNKSNYSQPPLLADAVLKTHAGFMAKGKEEEAQALLSEFYEPLAKFYGYFRGRRRTDPDSELISVISMHETGRDFDPTGDSERLRLNRDGSKIVDGVNSALGYLSDLSVNARHRMDNWTEEKTIKRYSIKDVMFNCIYAENLNYMGQIANLLGKSTEAILYQNLSQQVGQDIVEYMWNDKYQRFYGIGKNGEQIPITTVSNLFPLLLDDVPKSHIESILHLLDSPKWFNTPYPIPTVPKAYENPKNRKDKLYDPHFQEKLIWRGPTWMNMNWYIVNGLIKQRDRYALEDPGLAYRLNERALIIAQKSAELVDREGCRESYDSETGKGQRVKSFAWSTLGYLLKDSIIDLARFRQDIQSKYGALVA